MASAKAMKRLERLRRSTANAKPEDIKALYLAFGFVIEPRKGHDRVIHPDYPDDRDLYGSIPRHRVLAEYVAKQAVELVEKLLILEQAKEDRNAKQ